MNLWAYTQGVVLDFSRRGKHSGLEGVTCLVIFGPAEA